MSGKEAKKKDWSVSKEAKVESGKADAKARRGPAALLDSKMLSITTSF